MEQPNNTYKYLSIALAIIAIIFAVLYFTKQSQPVSDTYKDISSDVKDCQEQIANWQKVNGTVATATTSQAARSELEGILSKCQGLVGDSQEKL